MRDTLVRKAYSIMKKIFSSLLVLIMLGSCVGDDFNTDLLVDDVNISSQTGVAIQLAKANVTIEDIFSESTDMVKYDGDKVILFQENDSVEYVGLDDFFRMSLQPIEFTIPYAAMQNQAEISQLINIDFNIPNANLSLVDLDYKVVVSGSYLPSALQVELSVPVVNEFEDTKALDFDLPFVYNVITVADSVSIEGERLALDGNSIPMQLNIKVLDNVYNTFGDATIKIEMKDIALTYVKGTMQENRVNMDKGTYNLDFDVLEDLPGDVQFADPKLLIVMDNATPFSGIIEASMYGVSEDEKTPLDIDAFVMDGNTGSEPSTRTTNIFDKNNSNVASVFDLMPDELEYDGVLTLNPGGAYNSEFEMTNEDRIYVGYGFEIPLDLLLNAEMDQDTLELDDFDGLEDIAAAQFIVNTVNGLPLNAAASVYFYDEETDAIIDEVELTMIKAAQVDAEGIVVQASEEEFVTELTEAEVDNLNRAEKLLISVRLNTADFEEGKTVVFLKHNALELNLAIRAKANQLKL